MATKYQGNKRTQNSRGATQVEKAYFGQKPNKKDHASLVAQLESCGGFIMDFLQAADATDRLTAFYDNEEHSWVVFYNLGIPPGFSKELVFTGRGKSLLKAVAIVAYWIQSGASLDTFFPYAKEEESVDW